MNYERLLSAVGKDIGSLQEEDFFHYREMLDLRRFKLSKGLETDKKELELPEGVYGWSKKGKDEWVGKLETVKTSEILFNPEDHFKWFWHKHNTEMALNRLEYQTHGSVYPIAAYRSNGQLVSIQASFSRLVFAREIGLEEIKVFVVETEGGYAKNRQHYCNSGSQTSTPLHCPPISPKQIQQMHGPTVGDKLDSILKSLDSTYK